MEAFSPCWTAVSVYILSSSRPRDPRQQVLREYLLCADSEGSAPLVGGSSHELRTGRCTQPGKSDSQRVVGCPASLRRGSVLPMIFVAHLRPNCLQLLLVRCSQGKVRHGHFHEGPGPRPVVERRHCSADIGCAHRTAALEDVRPSDCLTGFERRKLARWPFCIDLISWLVLPVRHLRQ